ncbi:sugar phosphate isomerase/epimerase family protein [Paenibacillus spongiae]|uniref:Sugar phosphate isomerase/epimerase n=1 Tax=Paenibacillus spongiae TaxID=2909671 RepID=A0ABY5SHZ1_9BACL|nr:sugar phosphate isomerase/epimerase [Paenibacillus spongiae]UVI33254.1 sugar phosphate isomerase/epimerase [Paenibacillus spongiae]
MRVGLSMFGTTYAMGLHPKSGRLPITPDQLLDQAAEAGLQGVELPPSILKGTDLSAIASKAREREMYITIASDGYDPDMLSDVFDLAVKLGAATVRTVVGGAKIGGDRREMAGKWKPFLEDVLGGLEAATRIAEKKGIVLALENHQDVASEELIWLCERIASPHFGLTLDTGNPLATAEMVVDFAERISPYIKHVHLKDYWCYLSTEGYRLVRCPVGQGVVDFPSLLNLFRHAAPNVAMSIEIGALEARHIRVLSDDYWPEYPPRSALQLANVIRFVQDNAKPPEDWRTPYERGEPADAVIAYENGQLASSIAYMHRIMRNLNISEAEVS